MKIHASINKRALFLLEGVVAVGMLFASSSFAGDPKAVGDVCGRDLNVDIFGWDGGIIRKAGHVGVYDGSNVLEVLDASPVVQKNTLTSFKNTTSFWGARYIPGKYSFANVIDTGWNQRNYSPTYTLTAQYTVGKWITKQVWDAKMQKWLTVLELRRGKFRCDTFVYYAFDAGIGYKLAGKTILPRTVYNNCPNAR